MKTVMKKLKMGVLLTGLVVLSSCGNQSVVGSAFGINIISRAIPAVATKVTKYSEEKIIEFLQSPSVAKKENGTKVKKVEKTGSSPKIKGITINVSKDARLV